MKTCFNKILWIAIIIILSTGTFKISAQPDGFPGTTLELDGVDDYVQLSDVLPIGSTSSTFECWVKVPLVGTNNLEPGEWAGTLLGNFNDNPNINYEITDQGILLFYWNGEYLLGTTDLRDNQWHHLAFVRDKAAGKVILYLDGAVEGIHSGSFSDITLTTIHRLGCDNRASGWHFLHGKMEEVRLWTVARSQQQVRESMHLPMAGNEEGLIFYWQFNEGSGTTLTDIISGNDGTLQNMDNSDWIISTIPFGEGVVDTQTEAEGSVVFTGTGLSIEYSSQSGASVSANRLNLEPNLAPTIPDVVYDDQYWVINRYGTGSFDGDLTFTLNEDLSVTEQNLPENFELYSRTSTSDGDWTLLTSASSVNANLNQITFENITDFSQFIIVKANEPDGFPGTALSFDGGTEYVECANDPSLNIANNITVEAWVKPGSMSSNRQIIKKGDLSFLYWDAVLEDIPGHGIQIYLPGLAGYWEFHRVMDFNTWVHVAWTYDDLGNLTAYVNGEFTRQSNLPGSISINTNALEFASSTDGFNGILDEVRIWNVVRTNEQIVESMHLPLTGTETGLISYWQFNEGSGTTLTDIVSGNDGTLQNMEEADWLTSSIPFGDGFVNTQTEADGAIDFTNTGLSINYTSQSGASVSANRIDLSPNLIPTFSDVVYDDQYWVINRYGTGAFDGDLTFTLNEELTVDDENEPSFIELYTRSSTSDQEWVLQSSASTVNAATNQATFEGITDFSQFIILKRNEPDGFPGTTINFNGVDEYIQLSSILPVGSISSTFEFWVKVPLVGTHNLAPGERVGVMLSNYSDSPNGPTMTWEIHGNGQMRIYWELSSGASYAAWGNTDLRDNQWHHLAYVRDRVADEIRFYVDGKLDLTHPTAWTDITINTIHRIGRDNRPNNPPWFHGNIEEIRGWNLVRTQEEIQENMHLPLTGLESGLLYYWQFNEGSGTTLTDIISGNDGTLQNMEEVDWVTSTIPFGDGIVNTQTEANGVLDFTNTGLSINYTSQSGETVSANRINLTPNLTPTLSDVVFDDQYWVVNRYGTGTFDGDLTFTLNEDLAGDEEAYRINLYTRTSTSDEDWTWVSSAASINTDNEEATFEGITGFSQFVLGKTNCVDPDIPTVLADPAITCSLNSSTLSITSGNLYDATDWQWYSGSCGGTSIGTGISVSVSPTVTSTYYVRGEGGCVTPGTCAEITVTVVNVTSGTWLGNTTDWFDVDNWCGGIPIATTDIEIPGGLTNYPIINAVGAVCQNITIESDASLEIVGTNELAVSGNWVNDGSFTEGTSTITFDGTNALQTISGTSPTTFYILEIDLGDQARILEATSLIALSSTADPLVITSGTFKLSSASTIAPFTSNTGAVIPAQGGLWNNGGTLNTNNTCTWSNYGIIRNTSGAMNIGVNSGNSLKYYTGSSFVMEGGTMNIAGRFCPNTVSQTINFNMSGGNLNIVDVKQSSTTFASFDIPEIGSSFTMSGGTIVLKNLNGTTGTQRDYRNQAGTVNITGGTVQFGTTTTTADSPNFIVGDAYEKSVLPNTVLVQVTIYSTVTLIGDIEIIGDLLINSGTTLDANGEDIDISGDWTNDGITTSGTGIVTFNGITDQTISGGNTFYDVLIDKTTGDLILANDNTVSDVLTLDASNLGNILTGANSLIVSNNASASIDRQGSGHIVGNLQRAIPADANSYLYPIGTSTAYAPVIIDFDIGTVAGNLTGTTVDGDHADIGSSNVDGNSSVNRNWSFTINSGLTTVNYNATFNWVSADEDVGFDFNTAIAGKLDGTNWTYPTMGILSATSAQITNISGFSDFQIGNSNCNQPEVPIAEATPSTICEGEVTTLNILSGDLNDAVAWHWYSGSCGEISLGTGNLISVSPATTTTYYVRGEGACVTPGSCAVVTVTVNPTATISGYYNYYNAANTPLEGVEVELQQSGSYIDDVTTDGDGYYEFTGVCQGDYYFVTTYDAQTGYINSTDAAQVNYWPVFPGEIELAKFYAGDVNGDLSVSANDASNIQQYFVTLGNPDPMFTSSWSFWSAGETITNNTGTNDFPSISVVAGETYVSQNFYGLGTGDFNGSFNPGAKESVSETLSLKYGGVIELGFGEFELPLYSEMNMTVGAISLILELPTNILEVHDIYLGNDPQIPVLFSVFENELRISWQSALPFTVQKNEPLITLKMELIEIPEEGEINIALHSSQMNELADNNFNVINNVVLVVDVIHTSIVGIVDNSNIEEVTLESYPNPFADEINFEYSIPVEGRVQIEIYDLVGNKVNVIMNESKQVGSYVAKTDDLNLSPGIYMATMKVENKEFSFMRTIKIICK